MSPSPPTENPRRSASEVIARIGSGGRAVVAMSGGVASTLVAALAFEAHGPEAVAVTLTGPADSSAEDDRARRAAATIGIEHVLLTTDPLASPAYVVNGPDRCYHCRSVETAQLTAFGRGRAVRQYLDGVQRDDLADDRPGIRAMDEAGFAHPLLWARWGKAEVRSEARRRGLPNWDQPSDACLASRIAHGEPVTAEVLARIESAEQVLLRHGFRRVRVRVRHGAARIEVDPEELARLLAEPLASEVVRAVGAMGFASVAIDPRGYRGGSASLPVLP